MAGQTVYNYLTKIILMNPEKQKIEQWREYITDGKINWRAWVPYPEGFSKEMQALLDEASTFTELAMSINRTDGIIFDNLERFDRFTRIAMDKGLITKQEYLDIQGAKHKAA